MSTPTSPVCTPYSPARRARYATRALAASVLVGVQPQLMHVPPANSRSITAICQPARASAVASGPPACPAPITIPSNCLLSVMLTRSSP